jgi:predicted SAM-dependent methyltransferase
MQTLPPEFVEATYLELNPDVAAAVGSGAITSGADHYLRYGMKENRRITRGARSKPLPFPFPAGCQPTRRDRLLTNLDLRNMAGLEIGALASPLVKPSEGNIFFVDHADTQAIRRKYANEKHWVNVEDIVEVDAVWGEQTLQECIGHSKKVDYVIASHVIEHVPDLITWLAEIHEVLTSGGSLRLAVPDRRYTFDYLRNESRLSDALEAYLLRARRPLPRFIIEHRHMARVVDVTSAWRGKLDVSELHPHSSVVSGLEAAKDSIVNGAYHDTHCWIFTPISFANLFYQLAELDLVGFACERFFETPRNVFEFYVHLSPSADKARILDSWESIRRDLLKSPTYQKSSQDLEDLENILRSEYAAE